ncbi:recombinase family protein [uncultured Sanguibacteroides sp.]|uniref:recombinase family protein n=1 Tax=uncultured Sanguibacteroides sp. TaxID=1635151 RepID=UPI0025E95C12|nr:recombinase family protein [uncultured Sanguibacteroides sp.]
MVIAYLRVSTGKQHLANQREEIVKYASRKGLKIERWVTEIVSGKKKERERKLGKLMGSLQKGDVLIVTELSRLSRTLLDIMSILNRCLEKEIVIYSTKDGYAFDNSINSKVLAFAFALVAEIEHNLISIRTKEALAVRKAEGVKLGRPRGTTKQDFLFKHQKEIEKMYQAGKSISHICRHYKVSRETFYMADRNYHILKRNE